MATYNDYLRYKRRKRRRRQRSRLMPLLLTVVLIAAAIVWLRSTDKPEVNQLELVEQFHYVSSYKTPQVEVQGPYARMFNDEQDLQVLAAQMMGVNPVATADGIGRYIAKGRLIEVTDSTRYECLADYPYLTPAALHLLDEIAKRYQAYEKSPKRLRLTSCLRTVDHVKRLRRRNSNSVEKSCHLYGTTFDLSYSQMTVAEKRQLARALLELQRGGYCYVKHERKQPCFHITVRHSTPPVAVAR